MPSGRTCPPARQYGQGKELIHAPARCPRCRCTCLRQSLSRASGTSDPARRGFRSSPTWSSTGHDTALGVSGDPLNVSGRVGDFPMHSRCSAIISHSLSTCACCAFLSCSSTSTISARRPEPRDRCPSRRMREIAQRPTLWFPVIFAHRYPLLLLQFPDRPEQIQPMTDARDPQILQGRMVHHGQDITRDPVFCTSACMVLVPYARHFEVEQAGQDPPMMTSSYCGRPI